MPHFIIDIDKARFDKVEPKELMNSVHQVALESGLFEIANIKVRIKPYDHSLVAGQSGHFIHEFANIMSGSSTDKKAALSKSLFVTLKEKHPWIPVISVNVQEFEKATYCNLKML